jgi:hypothetical protein
MPPFGLLPMTNASNVKIKIKGYNFNKRKQYISILKNRQYCTLLMRLFISHEMSG